jgi:hypothetical protein
VKVPAYEMLREDRGLGQHMLGALLRGVSTREYQEVLPQMAQTVGVSRSAISRKTVEASAEQLKQLQERRCPAIPIELLLEKELATLRDELCEVGGPRRRRNGVEPQRDPRLIREADLAATESIEERAGAGQ